MAEQFAPFRNTGATPAIVRCFVAKPAKQRSLLPLHCAHTPVAVASLYRHDTEDGSKKCLSKPD